MKTSEILIRDPFILPVPDEKNYYMYGTTCSSENSDTDYDWMYPETGFYYYKSSDLVNWRGPFAAFIPGVDFWGKKDFWAAEVHEYKGRYYMFATCSSTEWNRAVQIFVSNSPGGPFVPLTNAPVTPHDYFCLDGTLYVEKAKDFESEDIPWIIFCHEWVQIGDGSILAMRLSEDLKEPIGQPITLFSASSAPWVRPLDVGKYVTDGPFLFRQDGKLCMLWSSFTEKGYAMGLAKSISGSIIGPWQQMNEPLYNSDEGHGMRFQTFDGKFMIVMHSPNHFPEHPVIRSFERIF